MKKFSFPALLLLLLAACAKKEARLDITFPESYEGEEVELMAFEDSVIIDKAVIKDGKASFVTLESDSMKFPVLANLNVNGRTKAFYIIEPGNAILVTDSMAVAKGTALNDKFIQLRVALDSLDNLGEVDKYIEYAGKVFGEEMNNPVGRYFGIEYIKFADPGKIAELMKNAPEDFAKRKRVARHLDSAKLRAATSAGSVYKDIQGEDAEGKPLSLSRFVTPGKYTIVDFMASWCPYCIKDFKKIKKLNEEYAGKDLQIVSIAVRDEPADTRAAVENHKMTWPVIYNTQKRPYAIYGFSGIPHYILIGPDGKIIVRSESFDKIQKTLENSI
ncbi:MAG: AhpC/TSA family protein [Prevotella sp.]|nr:AhpC/TSA family protein [Prevotella sp.]MCM1475046.1 AhpC/TSA family protein [Muribaculaceae bacterium]